MFIFSYQNLVRKGLTISWLIFKFDMLCLRSGAILQTSCKWSLQFESEATLQMVSDTY